MPAREQIESVPAEIDTAGGGPAADRGIRAEAGGGAGRRIRRGLIEEHHDGGFAG